MNRNQITTSLPPAQAEQQPVNANNMLARQITVQSDVLVPGLQALFSGIIGGLVLALLIGVLVPSVATNWRLWVGSFVLALAVAWFWRLSVIHDTLAWVEQVTQVDINGDGHIGPPTHWAEKHTWTDDERKEAVVDAEHRLAQFVRACYATGTTFRELRAAGFDDRDIVKYRRICLGNRDIAYYENGKGGKWVLTQADPGEAIKRLAMRGMFLPEP